MTTLQQVIDFIMDKASTSDIASVIEACQGKKKSQSQKSFYTLKVGDKVRFLSNSRPAYLRGMEGKVVAKRQTKLVIDLDEPAGRFHRGIITPPSLIEKV